MESTNWIQYWQDQEIISVLYSAIRETLQHRARRTGIVEMLFRVEFVYFFGKWGWSSNVRFFMRRNWSRNFCKLCKIWYRENRIASDQKNSGMYSDTRWSTSMENWRKSHKSQPFSCKTFEIDNVGWELR